MAKCTIKCIKEKDFAEVMQVVVDGVGTFSESPASFIIGDNIQFSVYQNTKGDLFVKGVV